MKSKFIKILSLIVALGLLSTTAFAAGFDKYTYDYANKVLTIEGSEFSKNETITIQILHKDKKISSLDGYYNPEKLESDFLLFIQIPAEDINPDEDVESYGYRLPVDMTADGEELPSGNYTIRVKGDGELTEAVIPFSSISHVDDLAKSIIAACETDDVAAAKSALGAILTVKSGKFDAESEAIKTLNINYPAFFTVDANKTLAIIYKAIKTAEVDGKSLASIKNDDSKVISRLDAVVDCITDAAKIQALYESGDSVVIDTKENGEYIFGIDDLREGKFVAVFNDADMVKEELKSKFTKTYFEDKGYKTSYDELPTMESVQEAFKTGVLLSVIDSIDSWTDVRDYIEELGEDTGIDMKDYGKLKSSQKSKLYTYGLECDDVATAEKFAEKMNDKIEELLKGEGGSGGGGSGGGGGSFGGAGVVSGNSGVTAPITPVDPSQIPPASTSVYSDLAGYEWAEESIEYLAEKSIVSGVGDGRFEPGRNVSREEMIKMLICAFGIDAQASAEAPFYDVDINAWYAPYVVTAKNAGYTSGLGDGTFGVGYSITREDAAVMAYRIAKDKGVDFTGAAKDAFSDDAQIAAYASEAVYALKSLGVISGKANGGFDPKGTCTRAEAARIIYALIK